MLTKHTHLVFLSYRLPRPSISKTANNTNIQSVSGLVNGLEPILKNHENSLWVGCREAVPGQENSTPTTNRIGSVNVATVDLSKATNKIFYTEFCVRILWPLLHSYSLDRLNTCRKEDLRDYFDTYRRVNHYIARNIKTLLHKDSVVWVHDYQHIPVGMALRDLGWQGKLGFFLHTPFPPVEILSSLAYSKELVQDFSAYDLVGFQTQRHRDNYVNAVRAKISGALDGQI